MSAPLRVMRPVLSEDPSLSPEANRLLTDELRAVIGADAVEVEATRPDHHADRHATHSTAVAGAIEMRLFLTMVGLIFLMVFVIVAAFVGEVDVLVGLALVLLVPATITVALVVNRMADEPEHVSPETHAILSKEGMGDPDRTFSELLDDFRAPKGTPAMH